MGCASPKSTRSNLVNITRLTLNQRHSKVILRHSRRFKKLFSSDPKSTNTTYYVSPSKHDILCIGFTGSGTSFYRLTSVTSVSTPASPVFCSTFSFTVVSISSKSIGKPASLVYNTRNASSVNPAIFVSLKKRRKKKKRKATKHMLLNVRYAHRRLIA